MRAALFYLRVKAWCTTLWSRRPSWLILLLAGRHGVPCIYPGAASRVAVRGSPVWWLHTG
jgi:hypothetical protein